MRGILTEIAWPRWAEHRALLARTLSDEDWGYATMAWMRLDASRVIGEPERGPLTDVELATIAAAADATELAPVAAEAEE